MYKHCLDEKKNFDERLRLFGEFRNRNFNFDSHLEGELASGKYSSKRYRRRMRGCRRHNSINRRILENIWENSSEETNGDVSDFTFLPFKSCEVLQPPLLSYLTSSSEDEASFWGNKEVKSSDLVIPKEKTTIYCSRHLKQENSEKVLTFSYVKSTSNKLTQTTLHLLPKKFEELIKPSNFPKDIYYKSLRPSINTIVSIIPIATIDKSTSTLVNKTANYLIEESKLASSNEQHNSSNIVRFMVNKDKAYHLLHEIIPNMSFPRRSKNISPSSSLIDRSETIQVQRLSLNSTTNITKQNAPLDTDIINNFPQANSEIAFQNNETDCNTVFGMDLSFLTHENILGPTLDETLKWLAPTLRKFNLIQEDAVSYDNYEEFPPGVMTILRGLFGQHLDDNVMEGLSIVFDMIRKQEAEKLNKKEKEDVSNPQKVLNTNVDRLQQQDYLLTEQTRSIEHFAISPLLPPSTTDNENLNKESYIDRATSPYHDSGEEIASSSSCSKDVGPSLSYSAFSPPLSQDRINSVEDIDKLPLLQNEMNQTDTEGSLKDKPGFEKLVSKTELKSEASTSTAEERSKIKDNSINILRDNSTNSKVTDFKILDLKSNKIAESMNTISDKSTGPSISSTTKTSNSIKSENVFENKSLLLRKDYLGSKCSYPPLEPLYPASILKASDARQGSEMSRTSNRQSVRPSYTKVNNSRTGSAKSMRNNSQKSLDLVRDSKTSTIRRNQSEEQRALLLTQGSLQKSATKSPSNEQNISDKITKQQRSSLYEYFVGDNSPEPSLADLQLNVNSIKTNSKKLNQSSETSQTHNSTVLNYSITSLGSTGGISKGSIDSNLRKSSDVQEDNLNAEISEAPAVASSTKSINITADEETNVESNLILDKKSEGSNTSERRSKTVIVSPQSSRSSLASDMSSVSKNKATSAKSSKNSIKTNTSTQSKRSRKNVLDKSENIDIVIKPLSGRQYLNEINELSENTASQTDFGKRKSSDLFKRKSSSVKSKSNEIKSSSSRSSKSLTEEELKLIENLRQSIATLHEEEQNRGRGRSKEEIEETFIEKMKKCVETSQQSAIKLVEDNENQIELRAQLDGLQENVAVRKNELKPCDQLTTQEILKKAWEDCAASNCKVCSRKLRDPSFKDLCSRACGLLCNIQMSDELQNVSLNRSKFDVESNTSESSEPTRKCFPGCMGLKSLHSIHDDHGETPSSDITRTPQVELSQVQSDDDKTEPEGTVSKDNILVPILKPTIEDIIKQQSSLNIDEIPSRSVTRKSIEDIAKEHIETTQDSTNSRNIPGPTVEDIVRDYHGNQLKNKPTKSDNKKNTDVKSLNTTPEAKSEQVLVEPVSSKETKEKKEFKDSFTMPLPEKEKSMRDQSVQHKPPQKISRTDQTMNGGGDESDIQLVKTMWSITRVNIYDDNSKTYEVMKSSSKRPRNIPTTSDVLFVVLPNGTTNSFTS